jgi:hypothetical protein
MMPVTTKEAYLNGEQTSDLPKYFHVDKSTYRVFLTPYALLCGAVDVQETTQGYVMIQKLSAGNAYKNVYRNKDEELLGSKVFRTLSQARRHLTYTE